MSKFKLAPLRLSPLRLPQSSRSLSISRASTAAIEEETLTNYTSQYYPVHIKQIFNNRYEVLAKLGYGGYSTVWLCQDKEWVSVCFRLSLLTCLLITIRHQSYKTVKVCIGNNLRDQEKIQDHLRDLSISNNDGQYCVRTYEDNFILESSSGHHQCYVYKPLGMSLLDYVNLQQGAILKVENFHYLVKFLLMGLDYLHCCSGIGIGIELT